MFSSTQTIHQKIPLNHNASPSKQEQTPQYPELGWYRRWSKPLLSLHLFVCLVWLYLFQSTKEPPFWMWQVWIMSILAIQFTWGFTVGLIVGRIAGSWGVYGE